MNQKLVKQDNQVVAFDHEALLLKAVENNVPVETMERLLAMRKDLKEEQAKEAFNQAMSQFQAECPVIQKTKEVKDRSGSVRYRYAPLDEIVRQVKPIMAKYGLSYTFKTLHQIDGVSEIIISCIPSHVMGHSSEGSSISIPIDPDAYMNDQQKRGSAQTFAKRYAFCNAFGIMTGDEDDDGNSLGNGITPQQIYAKARSHMEAVFANLDTVLAVKKAIAEENIEQAAEAMAEIDDAHVLSALGLAPTKGGCFTIEEKKVFTSDEYKDFYRQYREGREMEGL